MPFSNPWQSSKVVIVRRIALGLVLAIMVGWFLVGITLFPDGPVHACNPSADYLYTVHPFGYCGKQGQSHTFIDFTHFKFWEDRLQAFWPFGMIAVLVLGFGLPRRKRTGHA